MFLFAVLTFSFTCTEIYARSKTKVDSLVNYSYKLLNLGKLDSAMVYSKDALVIAEQSEKPILIAKVLINRAIINRRNSEFINSKSDYLRAYKISNKEGNFRYLSIIENNLGNLYMDLNQIDSALIYFFRSLEYKEKHASPSSILKTYNNISNAFRYNHQLDDALVHAQKSLNIIHTQKSISQSNIASTFIQLGNVHFEMANIDSAHFYYVRSLKISEEIGHLDKISTNQLNLGNIALERGDYQNSLTCYKACLKIIQNNGKNEEVIRVMNNIGNVWNKMEQLDSAYVYYLRAEQIAREQKIMKQLGPVLDNLSSVYQKKGNLDMAMSCLKERVEISQELYKEETANKIAELQTLYETEKKEKEIIYQQARIQETIIERNNLLFLLIVVILLAGVVVLIYIHRSRTLKLTNERNIEKHHKEITHILKDQELKSLDAMIEGQDTERKRIAEDLHDRLGTTLSAAKMHLESAEDSLKPKQYQYIDKLLNTAIDDTRQISHNMLSGVLTKFGLVAALSDLKETLEATDQLTVTLKTIQFDERLETDMELNLYRITQELVSNTLRHAQATTLNILLQKKNSSLILSVSDNGVGYKHVNEQKGIGLKNINSRVTKIGGSLKINTSVGVGTNTEIIVPV